MQVIGNSACDVKINQRRSQRAVFRFDPHGGREFGVAFDTSTTTITNHMEVEPNSQHFVALIGQRRRPTAPGTHRVQTPALDFIACDAGANQ
jgi:hypothetical protein